MFEGQVLGILADCALAFRIDTTRRLSAMTRWDVESDPHAHPVVYPAILGHLGDYRRVSIKLV